LKVFLSRKAAKAFEETPSDLRRRLEEKISEQRIPRVAENLEEHQMLTGSELVITESCTQYSRKTKFWCSRSLDARPHTSELSGEN
jgi:hypothetical protein